MGLMYCKCPSKSLTKLCASITLNFNKSFLYCFISTWKFLMINLMVDLLINQVSSVKHKWRLSQNHACVNQSPLEALLIFINFGYHLHHFVFMKIDQFLKNMSIAHANPFFVCYEQIKYAILSVHRVFSDKQHKKTIFGILRIVLLFVQSESKTLSIFEYHTLLTAI